ncbi:MAG: isoprenyl transferase [Bdellovibrionota bacterium]
MKTLNHIAIIMDGNGRWAQNKGRHRAFGHIQGVRVAKKIITAVREVGVPHLTLYAFSTENWNRPRQEVELLMKLLFKYLVRERALLVKQNIRFRVLGQIERLPQEIVKEIIKTVDATAGCTGMTLNMAISYGGREDIVQAFKKAHELILLGKLQPNNVTEETISGLLETAELPDPDLLIRTSGEQRLSNFLLWQSAYTELMFTDSLWPDFTKNDLLRAIEDYNKRERRFGRTSEQMTSNNI